MDRKLDFSGRTQLYYQLYDILYDDIKTGVYKSGELLPTESKLVEEFNVSRATVRKALDLLLNDGLISKRRGYGSYVQPHNVEQTTTKVLHFSSDMENRGYKSTTSMIENIMIPATKTIASALRINEGEPMVNVTRLRHADNMPMCMEYAYLIYKKCPLVHGQDFSKQSLRNFLFEKYDIVWKKASQKIYAITASSKQSKYLDIKEGDPLIYIERVSFSKTGEPIEYFQGYYRGDSYFLSAELEV